MILAAETWVWILVGLVAFPLVGLLVMLALGAAGAPGDTVRRAAQLATRRRYDDRGRPLPDEAPPDPDRREA